MAGLGVFGGEGLRLGFDLNTLRRAGNLQRQVGGGVLGDVQFDVSADGFLKPLHLRRHGIHPRRNRNKKVPSSAVRLRIELVSFVKIEKGNRCPLDYGSGGVCQHAAHSPKVSLAEKHRGDENKQDCGQQHREKYPSAIEYHF